MLAVPLRSTSQAPAMAYSCTCTLHTACHHPSHTPLAARSTFFAGKFPEGEFQEYHRGDGEVRNSSAEKRDRERMEASMINEVRQAAEVHRQVGRRCCIGLISGRKAALMWRRHLCIHIAAAHHKHVYFQASAMAQGHVLRVVGRF